MEYSRIYLQNMQIIEYFAILFLSLIIIKYEQLVRFQEEDDGGTTTGSPFFAFQKLLYSYIVTLVTQKSFPKTVIL